MTYSEAEIHDYFKNVTHFSFLSEGERDNQREFLRTRKKYTQNFCVRKSGNDYFHHDGNEFSVPLCSLG